MTPKDRGIVLALVAGFACVFAWLRPHGLIIADEGWYLHPVLRMLDGEFLYRDFAHHYAPLPFHAIAATFQLFGTSILVARTFWIVLLVASVAGIYLVARRLAPATVAALAALAYGLTPGPWHKAAYGFCTVLFLLALARALEKPTNLRALALGAAAGVGIMTRQELGIAQIVLALVLMFLVTPIQPPKPRRRLANVLRVALGFAAVVAPVLAYYQRNDALASLFREVFLQAALLSNRPPVDLLRLVHPATLASAYEGSGAGWLLLVPLGLVPVLVGRFGFLALRGPSQPVRTLLAFAILALCLPAFVQAYNPPLVARYLQSAIVFYLMVAWFLGSLEGRARRLATMAASAAVVAQFVAVVAGIDRIHPSDAYTGSVRVLRYRTPVEVLGDTVFTDEQTAAEIAAVRDFFGRHTRPGEPVFTAPLHSLYYVLLDRPNPTAYLGDIGNIAMTVERKEIEMKRLLDSGTRYAILDKPWWEKGPGPGNPVVNTLARTFRPVQTIGSLVILERQQDSSGSR